VDNLQKGSFKVKPVFSQGYEKVFRKIIMNYSPDRNENPPDFSSGDCSG
jgi:hypothetical protein